MKLRLALINITIPCVMLVALGFAPSHAILIPDYIATVLIGLTLGRALLLYQQQVLFSNFPILLVALPSSFGLALDVYAPFASYAFLLYVWVVNLQWSQRPWLHPLHILNLLLLVVFIAFAQRKINVPEPYLSYAYGSLIWPSFFFAVTPLLFISFWSRIGRWASYWPLLLMLAISVRWADESYLFLWLAFSALFSLSLDSYVMTYVDELTSIPGRRALEFKLKTQSKHFYVAMVDVDHFKKFNDTYGHQVGDDVLKVIAKLISLTHKAKAYRYGGEEFCLVFKNMPKDEVMEELNATRKRIEEYALYPKSLDRKKSNRGRTKKVKPLHITASFGVAQHHSGQKYEEVIARADKALYKAKQSGRNCVIASK